MPKKQRVRKPPRHTPCGYCFTEYATGYDHIIPQSYRKDHSKKNLYPCCKHCNSILGNKMFNSLEEKRQYIKNWLIGKKQWKFEITTTVSQEETRIEITIVKDWIQKKKERNLIEAYNDLTKFGIKPTFL